MTDRTRSGDGTPGPAREAAPRLAVCPCTLVEPCSRNCTCANSVMSGGCARCCTYGSREQQLAAARHLSGDGTPGPAPDDVRALAARLRPDALRAELGRAGTPGSIADLIAYIREYQGQSDMPPTWHEGVNYAIELIEERAWADAERPPQETK